MARNGAKIESLALAVASGMSVARAAKCVGIGRRTAVRYVASDEFQSRVRKLRREMTDRTIGTLTRASVKASRTLEKMLAHPRFAVSAAKAILDAKRALAESADFEERIIEVESRLAQQGGSK